MKKINLKNINIIRDWKIINVIFGIGLIVLSVFAWRIYLSNQIGGGYSSGQGSVVNVNLKNIDEKKLKEVVSILENKKSSFERIKSNQTKTVDPSL